MHVRISDCLLFYSFDILAVFLKFLSEYFLLMYLPVN